MRRKIKHWLGRPERKPDDEVKDDGTISLSRPLVASSVDPWEQAYAVLLDQKPELMADYAKHLCHSQSGTPSDVDLTAPQSVESVVQQLLKDREDKQWRISLLGKDVKVREQAEKLVKFLLWTDPIVKDALSAQPYAQLAWSGVSMLLSLMTSGSTQSQAMLEGFTSISNVQLYWQIYEENHSELERQQDHQPLREPLIKVYSQIIEYQACSICHLSRAQLSRAWASAAGSNEWNKMARNIEKSSEECSKFLHLLNEGKISEHWKKQLQEMQESQDTLTKIRRVLEENGTQNLKIYEDQREKELLQDIASNYKSDKDDVPRRTTRTCEWVFNDDDSFRKWRDSNTPGLLWITAGPGCGKSVLSRALIDEGRLSTNVATSTVCYFFFKDGDERRSHDTDALCAILHQLVTQDSSGRLIGNALPSHKSYGKQLTQNSSELWRILIACCQSPDAGEVICVFDALDECDKKSRQKLMDQLENFYTQSDLSNSASRLKVLVTSRLYPDLEVSFRKFSDMTTYWHLDGDSDVKSEAIGEEINHVIDARLRHITQGFGAEDRDEISRRLKGMGNRTYLWLHLTLREIEDFDCGSRSDIDRVLSTVSDEVFDKYEKILDRSQNRAETMFLLRIVLAAKRPLTMDEANIALKLASHEEQFASYAALQSNLWPRENFARKVRSLCGLFISIHGEELSFIHQTARDFLVHPKHQGNWRGCLDTAASHRTISRSRLYYLVLSEFEPPSDFAGASDLGPYLRYPFDLECPFLHYAALNWSSHFSQCLQEADAQVDSEMSKLAFALCDTSSTAYRAWSSLYAREKFGLPIVPEDASPLIVAAYLGNEAIVKQVLDMNEADVNSQDSVGRTPLIWAAYEGHWAVVEQLLATGKVDPDSKGSGGRTPLLYAAQSGHEAIVKQLLATGKVDPDSKDNRGWTPLLYTASGGYEAIVKQLLATGKVDPDSKDMDGWTPLLYAAGKGYEAIVKQLLATGKVDPDSKDNRGRTPVSSAVQRGNEAIVKQLLATGKVDPDSKDNRGRTPLSYAVHGGDEAIVKQLLSTGKVDPDSKDNRGWTPLLYAAGQGYEAIIKQLLATGEVDPDSKDEDGRTPLLHAARFGQEAIMKQLLATGKVDPDLKDIEGQTPLLYAASWGHKAIDEILKSH